MNAILHSETIDDKMKITTAFHRNTINKLNKQIQRLEKSFGKNSIATLSKRSSLISRYEKKIATWGLAGLALLATNGVNAQLSDEKNTTGTGSRDDADIARAPDGKFVITWAEDGDIFFERFDASGSSLGAPVEFENGTNLNSRRPDIGMDDSGNFVIAWVADNNSESFTEIHYQRFTTSGSALSSSIELTEASESGIKLDVAVAMDADGDFVIAHNVEGRGGFNNYGAGIMFNRFNSAGSDQCSGGVIVQPDMGSSYGYFNLDIDMDQDGDFVVIWERIVGSGDARVQAYLDNSSGCSAHSSISTIANGESITFDKMKPSVSMDDDDKFVVTWRNQDKIYANLFGYSSIPSFSSISSLITVATIQASGSSNAICTDVAMDADGDFVIVFNDDFVIPVSAPKPAKGTQHLKRAIPSSNSTPVILQKYNATGIAVGAPITVPDVLTANNLGASVASDPNCNYVVVWTSASAMPANTFKLLAPAAAPIPTISEWGGIVLGLLMSIFGITAIRNRKPKPKVYPVYLENRLDQK